MQTTEFVNLSGASGNYRLFQKLKILYSVVCLFHIGLRGARPYLSESRKMSRQKTVRVHFLYTLCMIAYYIRNTGVRIRYVDMQILS